jgi:hypothetical protein
MATMTRLTNALLMLDHLPDCSFQALDQTALL